nr:LysR substrate-binding domain-containing protein [Halomonas socia]
MVRVLIKILPTQEVINRVANNQLDLGIVYAPADDPALLSEELYAAEIMCAFPAGHPLESKGTIFPEDLVGHDLISISRNSPFGMAIEKAFEERGVARENVIEVSHSFVALSLVENGAGIGVVDPFVTMRRLFPNLVFCAFRPRVAINPRVVYARRKPLSRLQTSFIEHLKLVEFDVPY